SFFINSCFKNSPKDEGLHLTQALSLDDVDNWMLHQIEKDFAPFKNRCFTEQQVQNFAHSYKNATKKGFILIRFTPNRKYHLEIHSDIPVHHGLVAPQYINLMEKLSRLQVLPIKGALLIHMHDSDDDLNAKTELSSNDIPFFTFTKTKNSPSILIPDYDAVRGYEDKFLKNTELTSIPWKEKIEKVYWRGTNSGLPYEPERWREKERVKLSFLSLQFPNLIDAGLVDYEWYKPYMEEYLPLKERANFLDQVRYKYLIDIDGHSSTFPHMAWILASNSVLMKLESPNIQWYYQLLEPMKNFIPIKKDFSDLFTQLEWAQSHDEEVKSIANQGSYLAHLVFSSTNIEKYMLLVMQKFSEHFGESCYKRNP
ncbi:MAG: hypothetical protein K2X39_04500, partial [Silvanigrellaceae bacterium]|nr:hypothetical protein [Silvanigrellaceae bacterium]